jgi:hypothetical protein
LQFHVYFVLCQYEIQIKPTHITSLVIKFEFYFHIPFSNHFVSLGQIKVFIKKLLAALRRVRQVQFIPKKVL